MRLRAAKYLFNQVRPVAGYTAGSNEASKITLSNRTWKDSAARRTTHFFANAVQCLSLPKLSVHRIWQYSARSSTVSHEDRQNGLLRTRCQSSENIEPNSNRDLNKPPKKLS